MRRDDDPARRRPASAPCSRSCSPCFARDVGRWPQAIRAGDVAAADPAHRRASRGRSTRRCRSRRPGASLGLGDDLAFRRAALLFRRAYTRDPELEHAAPRAAGARIRAETALAHVIRADSDRRASVHRVEPARHPRARRRGHGARRQRPDRSQRLRVPGRDPARPGQRAGEDEPRAALPAELVQVLGPRTRAPPALRACGRERVGCRARLLMHSTSITPTAALVALVGLVPLALVARRRAAERRAAGPARAARAVPGRGGRCRPRSSRSPPSLGPRRRAAGPPQRRSLASPGSTRRRSSPSTPRRRWTASTTAESDVRLDRARRDRAADPRPRSPTCPPASARSPTARSRCCSRPPTATRSPPPSRSRSVSSGRPVSQSSTTISSFDAVAPFPLEGYFRRGAKKRLLVILTDAESTGFNERRRPQELRGETADGRRPRPHRRERGACLRAERPAGERLHPAPGDRRDAAAASSPRHAAVAYGEDDVAGAERAAARRARLRADGEPRLDIRQTRPGAVARRRGRRPAGVVLRRRNL